MNIKAERVRSYRQHVHHLDQKISMAGILHAAGACGLQNSPPGAWETALFNRLEGCTLPLLQDALYEDKRLLQAWSFRGAPVVFPADESDIFLTPLMAREGEEPWIYTAGIAAALAYLQMPFDELLTRVRREVKRMGSRTVKSKEALDQILAAAVQEELPVEKQALWRGPSMYGDPARQTVGEAAVSFLLRPCSFSSLLVFGRREGVSPTFASYENWTGRAPKSLPDPGKELVRRFLHCYGPAAPDFLMNWLGCSARQAHRLWDALAGEMEPVAVDGKMRCMLVSDMDSLLHTQDTEARILLLGAHDPYLDMRDRSIILENKNLHKKVWKYSGNPGVILKDGSIIGIWRQKTLKNNLEITMSVWEKVSPIELQALKNLAEEYASFRQRTLQSCAIDL